MTFYNKDKGFVWVIVWLAVVEKLFWTWNKVYHHHQLGRVLVGVAAVERLKLQWMYGPKQVVVVHREVVDFSGGSTVLKKYCCWKETWIHRFLWCAVIWVICDLWSFCGINPEKRILNIHVLQWKCPSVQVTIGAGKRLSEIIWNPWTFSMLRDSFTAQSMCKLWSSHSISLFVNQSDASGNKPVGSVQNKPVRSTNKFDV